MRTTDPLLINYPIRIRMATIGVILIVALIFYYLPRFLEESQNTDGNITQEIQTFDIPQTEQFELPEPPPRPSVPVASEEEDFDDDITIEDTDFEDFDAWESPPAMGGGPKVTFVPFDKPPVAIKAPKPKYPEIARDAGIEGTVYVQFYINKKGIVTEAFVSKTTVPNTGCDEAAIEAIKQSKWKPAQQRDKKVGVWQMMPIKFVLH